MGKESGLGQGLGALFGSLGAEPDEFLDGAHDSAGAVSQVALDLIDNDTLQPRKQFADDKLEELAKSIRTHGVMQPLIVARRENGRYRIIAGERRFRASRLAGLAEVPVVVREQVEDRDALEMALIENIQREDLNPMEQAAALQRLVRDYGMKQEEIAERVGKSRSAVANLMRLLNLPHAVQQMVEAEEISAGHARALLALQDENSIHTAADWIKKTGSVGQRNRGTGPQYALAAGKKGRTETGEAGGPACVPGCYGNAERPLRYEGTYCRQ